MTLSPLQYSCNPMMLWKLLIAFHLVHGDIIRDDGYHDFGGHFTVAHKGRMLRILMFFKNVPQEICASHCVRHLQCRTINYNQERKDCELTDEDFDVMNVDTITPGWYNYGTPPKIDDGWSEWRNYTDCTKKCGNGKLEQWRGCDSPRPEHGGAECEGRMRRTVRCNTHECEVVNLALGKTAKQSMNVYHFYTNSGDAYRAVDGSTSTYAFISWQVKPWWEIDLVEVRVIKIIELNGEIGDSRTNKGLIVETRIIEKDSWIICKDIGDLKQRPLEFKCDKQSTIARFLKIRSTKLLYMRLYEVVVLGY